MSKLRLFIQIAQVTLTFVIFLHAFPSPSQSTTAEDKYYGNTPKEYAPYDRFSEPYKRFFLAPNQYYGYGRSIAEPTDIQEVRIGFLGPIEKTVSVATGGVSHEEDLGIKMLQGAELAIALANKRGGYRNTGIPYTLVVRNDNGLWGSSANEIVRLAYTDRVWAVIGTIDGANSHIAIRAALKAELSVVNTGNTDPTFTETAIPWAFRNITDDRQMGYLLADYIFKVRGMKRVVAFRANNRYGRIGIDEIREAATRLGTPFLVEINYQQGDKDFSSQLETIKQLKPEAVVTYGDAEESANLLNQMRKAGLDIWFIGSDRIVSEKFIQLVSSSLEKVVAAYSYNPASSDEKYRRFAQTYEEQYGAMPEVFASHAFDGVNMIVDAIEKAGLNRAKIRDALASLKNYEGVTGRKHFDPIFNNLSSPLLAVGKGNHFYFTTLDELIEK